MPTSTIVNTYHNTCFGHDDDVARALQRQGLCQQLEALQRQGLCQEAVVDAVSAPLRPEEHDGGA